MVIIRRLHEPNCCSQLATSRMQGCCGISRSLYLSHAYTPKDQQQRHSKGSAHTRRLLWVASTPADRRARGISQKTRADRLSHLSSRMAAWVDNSPRVWTCKPVSVGADKKG